MDVLDHLMQEHRNVERMLAELAASEVGPDREETLAELSDALDFHMEVEERDVYPLVEEHLGEQKADQAEGEHDLARTALTDAADEVNGDGFIAAIETLTAAIGRHVQEEESEIFPQLRAKAADDVAALGDPDQLEAEVAEELDAEAPEDLTS